jgi:hypothetical protein
LAAGEIGFESDTNKFKIGTGSTAWASLPYAASISPLTTKGDLYAYSTADARLAVGADGETLVADSSTSTGLRYQAPVNANPVLNSSFQIWQRGTSISYNNNQLYNADRWLSQLPGTGTVSRQVTNDTTNLPFIQYCARLQRTAGQTATSGHFLYQNFESINSIPYAGKTVTYSFYARKGADYSAASSALVANLYSGTGTDQNVLASYTGFATVATTTATLTATWQRFTVTGTVATSATELSLGFSFTPVGTAGAADYFEVTGIQLEVGSVATPFKTYAATIQGELAACQRYYFRIVGTGNYDVFAYGSGWSSTAADMAINLPVAMRTIPASLDYSGLLLQSYGTATVYAITNAFLGLATPTIGNITIGVASGSSAGSVQRGLLTNSTTAFIGFSAEL